MTLRIPLAMLLFLLSAPALACPANSVWLGDTSEGTDTIRNCRCFPGFIPRGTAQCVPHDQGPDDRRLPQHAMKLVADAFALNMPGLQYTAKALRDRIDRGDPFDPEAQQALSFVEGMLVAEETMKRWNLRGSTWPVDPSELKGVWEKMRAAEDQILLPEATVEPDWVIWMRNGRSELVNTALVESGYDRHKAESALRAQLGEPPAIPRANAHRFIQGMILYFSGG